MSSRPSSWIDPILTEVGKRLIEVGIELPMQGGDRVSGRFAGRRYDRAPAPEIVHLSLLFHKPAGPGGMAPPMQIYTQRSHWPDTQIRDQRREFAPPLTATAAASRSEAVDSLMGCDFTDGREIAPARFLARAGRIQLLLLTSRKAIILVRSSADVMPPYGFMLCPDTTWSGLAINRSSVALSHTMSAPFMALE